MMPNIKLLDTVAVREDVPALGLSAGEVGAVVELLSGGAFEVEFVDESGQTYAMHTLNPAQVILLHQRGRAFQLRANVA